LIKKLEGDIEETKLELAELTPTDYLDIYESKFRANSPRRISPSKHPLRLNTREAPTIENTFDWSSTYIPYFDRVQTDDSEVYDLVDSQDAENPPEELKMNP